MLVCITCWFVLLVSQAHLCSSMPIPKITIFWEKGKDKHDVDQQCSKYLLIFVHVGQKL